MKTHLDKILSRCHHDPSQYLGAHFDTPKKGYITLRTYQPSAKSVNVAFKNELFVMDRFHSEGLFAVVLVADQLNDPQLDPFSYQYEIHYHDNSVIKINDPFRFSTQLSEQDRFLFNAGRNYKLYNHLGSHPKTLNNIKGTLFRVWAPNAQSLSVISNFNAWDDRVHQMKSLGNSGIWELFIPQFPTGEIYKFSIKTKHHAILEKSDPFQFYGELRPNTASITQEINSFEWHDDEWQQEKRNTSPYDKAMAIYEIHPGSWRRDPSSPDRFLTYKELAKELIPYVKKLGFTHIELMPIMEHPLDESWGYQVTAPYSVTSRYGTPEEFVYFVDQCHLNNIGVILDWVPAHFPKDAHSLASFDGTALYEHEDHRRGEHPEWGTLIYNYGRNEVSNYLIANALFWIEKYHIDGLRVDAVASMLYLDYSRKEGEWLPNCYGGRENLEAIEFIRHLNSILYDEFPNTLMIAEESTSFYGVSKPADEGGLGYGFKWNMGWMNDTLDYFSKDPLYRKYHHNALTFSMMYAFSENFILPLSHDEVVHGKRSLIDKMPGDIWQKFAGLRLLLLSMWMHPGKKLLFMGGEFGQSAEWYCKKSLDWHLLEKEGYHRQLLTFVSDLNTMYKNNPSLWELDFSSDGFGWVDLEDRNNSIISYTRYAKNKDDHLVCILNFTPQPHQNYTISLPKQCKYKELLSSDSNIYGGSTNSDGKMYKAVTPPHAQAPFHTIIDIPPLSGVILQPRK